MSLPYTSEPFNPKSNQNRINEVNPQTFVSCFSRPRDTNANTWDNFQSLLTPPKISFDCKPITWDTSDQVLCVFKQGQTLSSSSCHFHKPPADITCTCWLLLLKALSVYRLHRFTHQWCLAVCSLANKAWLLYFRTLMWIQISFRTNFSQDQACDSDRESCNRFWSREQNSELRSMWQDVETRFYNDRIKVSEPSEQKLCVL